MSEFQLLPIHKEYYCLGKHRSRNSPYIGETANSARVFHLEEPVDPNTELEFGAVWEIPKKVEMPDYLPSPDAVVSKKIYDILAPLNIHGLQLLKATITVKGITYEDYWGLHIYNNIECFDAENSEAELEAFNIWGEGVVLNAAILEKIPLSERLIFRLGEVPGMKIVHKSIVEKLEAIEPKDLKCILLLDYEG